MDTFLSFCRGCTNMVGTAGAILLFLVFSPLLFAVLIFGLPIFCIIGLFAGNSKES